jgi:hypothetical protein
MPFANFARSFGSVKSGFFITVIIFFKNYSLF